MNFSPALQILLSIVFVVSIFGGVAAQHHHHHHHPGGFGPPGFGPPGFGPPGFGPPGFGHGHNRFRREYKLESSPNSVIPNSTVLAQPSRSLINLNLLCPVCYQVLCLIKELQSELNCATLDLLVIQLNLQITTIPALCQTIAVNLNLNLLIVLLKEDASPTSGLEKCSSGSCITVADLISLITNGCVSSCNVNNLLTCSNTYLLNTLCPCVCGLLG